MINYSGLTNSKPNVTYDTSQLEARGFKLNFALNPENSVYEEVIEKCKKENFSYEIINGKGRQKHIWIKDWKDV